MAVDVKALRIARRASPQLVAYLDVPINRELLAASKTMARSST